MSRDPVSSTSQPSISRIERLLIICPTWVGDTVMATPIFRAARERIPGARIIAAVRPGHDDLLSGCPWIDESLVVNMKGLTGPIRAAAEIRRKQPQAILLLPNSFRSALTARLSSVPIRIGYDRDGRGRLLTHRLPVERSSLPTPMISYYLHLAGFALNDKSAAPSGARKGRADSGGGGIDPRMELFVTDQEESAADELLRELDGPFVLLNPGASKLAKRWPPDRFAHAANALRKSHGLSAVVTGTPAEREVLNAVVAAGRNPIINLADRGLSLGSLKAVTRRASLMITNDTGPRHIAVALGTPVVSLFGPTDPRWTTLNCPREVILQAEPFLPEELIADQHPDRCSVDRITVADVVAACDRLLDEGSDPDRSERP